MALRPWPAAVPRGRHIAKFAPDAKASAQELKLAQQLIEASTSDKFDFSNYADTHTEHLKSLIEAKVAGKEIVAPPETEEETLVINLMDALKKSMKQKKRPASSAKAKQARKILADHLSRQTAAGRRRRKSS